MVRRTRARPIISFSAILSDRTTTASLHAWRAARPGALGLLDDYASVARAALALFEGSGDPGELETARQLAGDALDRFGDGEGGVYLTAADAARRSGREAPPCA